jgi:hypothetical protein
MVLRILTESGEFHASSDVNAVGRCDQPPAGECLSGGFDFLSYHFEEGVSLSPQEESAKAEGLDREQARRRKGYSLARIIEIINLILRRLARILQA